MREGREIAIQELRRLWRAGLDSGEAQPLNAEDIKRRGRDRLAARAGADL